MKTPEAESGAVTPVQTPAWLCGRRDLLIAFTIFALSMALRLVRFRQSLWLDEFTSLYDSILVPWRMTVATPAGHYLPNNHVLYNVLARCCVAVGGGSLDRPGPLAVMVRLPSLVAGSLTPVAVAWPLRRSAPVTALLLALLTAVHPWLIAESDEARGYALMVLLGVVATHLLPVRPRTWPVAYAMAVAAAIWAVPVAAVLLAGHGVAVVLFRRDTLVSWLRGAAVAVVVTLLLYLPMTGGIAAYVRHPEVAPADYLDFADQLPRFAFVGQYLPPIPDPAAPLPPAGIGILYWIIPVAAIAAGTFFGRRSRPLSKLLPAFAAASLVGAVIPLVIPTAGQVRFFPWWGLWFCVAVVALAPRSRPAVLFPAAAVILGWLLWAGLSMPPEQPAREAIRRADRLAPAGRRILVAFMSADRSAASYGRDCAHPVESAESPMKFARAEAALMRADGRRPWLVVSFEFLIRDFDPDAWAYLRLHYRLVERLPGRVSPVAVYAPRE